MKPQTVPRVVTPARFIRSVDLIRVTLLWIAITGTANGYGSAFAGLMIAVAALYFIEFGYIYEKKAESEIMTFKEKALYTLMHIGVLNFLLDAPGANLSGLRIQHILIILINAAALAAVVFAYTYIDTFDRAWGCYKCHGKPYDIYSFKSGYCASYTNYWQPNNGNTEGKQTSVGNIKKVDSSFGNPLEDHCQSTATLPGVYESRMPNWWHAATVMVVSSFSIYLGLIPFKITAMEQARKKPDKAML